MISRMFLIAFAGSVFGLLVECFGAEFFGLWGNHRDFGPRLPAAGALTGALLAIVGAVAGEWELPGWMKRLSVATLAGLCFGVFTRGIRLRARS